MPLSLIFVIIIVTTAIFITLVILINKKKKKEKYPTSHKQKEITLDNILNEPQNYSKPVEPSIQIINTSDKKLPSPQRPITKEDAIVADLLRQHSELPGGVAELSQILQDPDIEIKKVVKIISTYPVLSAKILKVVNSAAFTTSKITSIQHAVVILGFNNLWLLMNQLLTSTALNSFAKLSHDQIKGLWKHGAAVATCAKYVLMQTNFNINNVGPIIYTCSLLHDVGKFILKGLNPIKFQDETEIDQNFSLLGETKNIGLDHCRAGFLITTYWKLPEILCTTISYHHHPSFYNWQDIPQHAKIPTILVSISDMVANLAGYYEQCPATFDINKECLNYVGLDKNWDPNMLITQELIKELKDTERLIEAATTL